MKLHGFAGSARTAIAINALDAAGLTYEKVWHTMGQTHTEEFLKLNPQGKTPTLETPEGPIFETTAILRHIARTSGKLYGTGLYQNALVDQWLCFVDNEIMPAASSVMPALFGFPLPKPVDINQAKATISTKLAVLEKALAGKKFLVGDSLTIADIAVANVAYGILGLAYSDKERQAFGQVIAHITAYAETPYFKSIYGKLRWVPEGYKAPKADAAPKQPAAKADKPKEDKHKEDKPKEEKPKAAKIEEDEHAEPKQKDPEFPPTELNLMNFKTFFVNEKDMDAAMAEFWKQYKEGEWSLWQLKYIKYPGECEVVYRTNNLLRTFLSRLENIRKWLFGTHFVLGDEPNLEIEGVWLIRGAELFDQLKEIDVFDTYTWTKLDSSKPEDKAIVTDFWTHRKEDEEKVAGKTIRTFKWIK